MWWCVSACQKEDAAAQEATVARIKQDLGAAYDFRRVEVVGPRVSGELVQSGTLGVVIAIIAVLCYLWFRFEWQFAVGAIIATMHDLLLTVGFFSITRLEFNTTSIAAILTIVGYSLNETVVVLDRIREMLKKYRRMPTDQLIDVSVNAVLPRTIMTATTVFLALLSLVVFGGEVIRSFSLAMIWGIFVATYSSVFICSPMLIYLGLRNESAEAPPAPAAEDEGGQTRNSSAARRGGEDEGTGVGARPQRHCEAAKRRSNPEVSRLDCFASLAMTASAVRSERVSDREIRRLPARQACNRRLWQRRLPFRRNVASRLDPGIALRHPSLGGSERRGYLHRFARRGLCGAAGRIEHLLIGTGADLVPLDKGLREKLRAAGIRAEPMATAAAARTYSILLAEDRRVAAALIAVS